MTVFVDTSAFLAVLDRDDRNHAAGSSTWRELIGQASLATSNYVLVECNALIQRRLGMPVLRRFESVVLDVVEVLWVDSAVHRRAVASLLLADRRRLSLVDCVSFDLMRSRNVERAFAFDGHFAEQGFTLIP